MGQLLFDYSELRKKIQSVYGSQESFAFKMEMGRSTLNLKLNNKSEWGQDEIAKALNLLDIPKEKISFYFFTPMV